MPDNGFLMTFPVFPPRSGYDRRMPLPAGVMVKFTNAEFILAFIQITDADVNPVINTHRLESGTHLLLGFAAGFGFYAVLQSRFFFG